MSFPVMFGAAPRPKPGPSPKPKPTDAPPNAPPLPGPPGPPVDFSTIDTGEKATLLPALSVPLMMTTAACIHDAGTGGAGITGTLEENLANSTKVALSYNMPQAGGPMQVTGAAGSQAINEVWTLTNASITMDGTVGQAKEHVVWSVRPDGTHVDGQVGNVPVHILLVGDGQGDTHGSGTAGSEAFQIGTQMHGAAQMTTTGRVGQTTTNMNTQLLTQDGKTVSVEGVGQTNGIPMTYRLDLTEGDVTNPPTPTPDPGPLPDPDPPDPDPGD